MIIIENVKGSCTNLYSSTLWIYKSDCQNIFALYNRDTMIVTQKNYFDHKNKTTFSYEECHYLISKSRGVTYSIYGAPSGRYSIPKNSFYQKISEI
jgi:hypothetical protein